MKILHLEDVKWEVAHAKLFGEGVWEVAVFQVHIKDINCRI